MRTLALLCVLALVPACASDGDGGGGGAPSRPYRRASEGPSGAAPTLRTFPPETQAFMKAGLEQFSRQDPRWPATRAQWLALGPREADFLVQTLWTALVSAQAKHAPELVERARHELALIGEPSIPLLAEILATGAVGTTTSAETGEEVTVGIDDLQRREAAEVLSLVGAPAVPALLDVLRRAETKSGRRIALTALGNMGPRGGRDAADALVAAARDPDWTLRVEAVHGMREHEDGATRAALVAALGDDEEQVRLKAANSIVHRRDASAAGALRAAASRAESAGRLAEARRYEKLAAALERPQPERR